MLKAYHNDPAIKEVLINQLQAHYDADEIIKGTYWQDGKGCAVGCSIHSSDHSLYEKELGLPECKISIENLLHLLKTNPENSEDAAWAAAGADAWAAKAARAAARASWASAGAAWAAEAAEAASWAAAWAAWAAEAAEASAWAAAWAAGAARAAGDEENTYIYFADKLIDLIESCE